MDENKVIPMKRGRGRPPGAGKKLAGDAPEDESFGNTPGTRIPWNGGLDEKALQRPGGLLLAALQQCANERGQTLRDMAAELGVTYGYISQLANGNRHVNQISDRFAEACALYLMRPRLAVLVMAGRITPKDAYESEELLVGEIPRAMEYIYKDSEWGPLLTPQIRALDTTSHFGIVRLYEEATKRRLLPQPLDLKQFMQMVAEYNAKLEAMKQEHLSRRSEDVVANSDFDHS